MTALSAPGVASLMAFGRWRCTQRNLLVSDHHLAQLTRMEPSGWRAMEHRLERLSMAFEQGAVLLDHDDATAMVQGQQPAQVAHEEQQRVDDLAAQLVGGAMDSVYTSMDVGGVDLHSPLEAWPVDDYEPPSWSEEQLGAGSDALEHRLRAAVDPVEPGRPSVLDVNERENTSSEPMTPAGWRSGRAVDVLVDLDSTIDERMNASTSSAVASSLELQRLEERMVVLAQRAVEADIEELITIADELRELEERLVELDPDRAPLPPFEDVSPNVRVAEAKKTGRRRASADAEESGSLTPTSPRASGTSTERALKPATFSWKKQQVVLFISLAFTHAPCWWVRKNEGALVDGRRSLLLSGQLRQMLRRAGWHRLLVPG